MNIKDMKLKIFTGTGIDYVKSVANSKKTGGNKINNIMTISEIKKFLREREIDLNTRVDMPNGGQYLYNLLAEFNDKVKRESKHKMIKHIHRYNLED